MKFLAKTALAFCVVASSAGAENAYHSHLENLVNSTISEWIADPDVVGAILAQNVETSAFSDEQVQELDTLWRSGSAEGNALINQVWSNELSGRLKALRDASPMVFAEIFVVDVRGLNVGQSNITSDYYQGDEAKWQVPQSTGEVHFGEVEFDESTQSYLSQVSAPIMHEGAFIGSITVGVNVEGL